MIEEVMQTVGHKDIATLNDVLAADRVAREAAHEWLACLGEAREPTIPATVGTEKNLSVIFSLLLAG